MNAEYFTLRFNFLSFSFLQYRRSIFWVGKSIFWLLKVYQAFDFLRYSDQEASRKDAFYIMYTRIYYVCVYMSRNLHYYQLLTYPLSTSF